MLLNSGTVIFLRKGNTELSLLVSFLLFTLDDFSKPGHSMWGLGSLSFSCVCTEETRNEEFTPPPKILVGILMVLVRRKLEPDFVLPLLSQIRPP